MKYYVANFKIEGAGNTEVCRDIIASLAAEAGFESFEENGDGLNGYVQQELLDEPLLKSLLKDFPIEGVNVSYSLKEAEYRNWNEQWENAGFEPIVIDGRCIIHDTKHPVADKALDSPTLDITIEARQAFGTGTHETTRMIVGELLKMDLKGKRILDCGCGTGILGICALKLGARHCVGYDIDEWSADNTRHNAVINHVDQQMDALCGDATLLDGISQRFQVVMANINRNILLNDMERFRSVMADGATLILSGFYENDCALLIGKAQTLGLSHCQTRVDGDWACMVLRATT